VQDESGQRPFANCAARHRLREYSHFRCIKYKCYYALPSMARSTGSVACRQRYGEKFWMAEALPCHPKVLDFVAGEGIAGRTGFGHTDA
jgi:hypothetical protein